MLRCRSPRRGRLRRCRGRPGPVGAAGNHDSSEHEGENDHQHCPSNVGAKLVAEVLVARESFCSRDDNEPRRDCAVDQPIKDEEVHDVEDENDAEDVDRQVLEKMDEMIEGHEEFISEQAAKMLGQEDIFSVAVLANQLKQMDQQFDAVLQTGIPEEGRAYLGMMGFKITINLHGEVLEIHQPGLTDPSKD